MVSVRKENLEPRISNLEPRTSNLEFYREIIHNKSFRKQ